jgi:hypothetical protein
MFGLSYAAVPTQEEATCFKYIYERPCRNRALTNPCKWDEALEKCKYFPGWVQPVADGTGIVDLDACVAESVNCPRYPAGTFAKEWPIRYVTGVDAPFCYYESNLEVLECKDICIELFETYTAETSWGVKVSQACQIGCGYAAIAMQNPATGMKCFEACKRTVWHYTDNTKCNYDQGLGLAVFEIIQFGSGKACELGCIVGNERPCGECDTMFN